MHVVSLLFHAHAEQLLWRWLNAREMPAEQHTQGARRRGAHHRLWENKGAALLRALHLGPVLSNRARSGRQNFGRNLSLEIGVKGNRKLNIKTVHTRVHTHTRTHPYPCMCIHIHTNLYTWRKTKHTTIWGLGVVITYWPNNEGGI